MFIGTIWRQPEISNPYFFLTFLTFEEDREEELLGLEDFVGEELDFERELIFFEEDFSDELFGEWFLMDLVFLSSILLIILLSEELDFWVLTVCGELFVVIFGEEGYP